MASGAGGAGPEAWREAGRGSGEPAVGALDSDVEVAWGEQGGEGRLRVTERVMGPSGMEGDDKTIVAQLGGGDFFLLLLISFERDSPMPLTSRLSSSCSRSPARPPGESVREIAAPVGVDWGEKAVS